MRIETLNIVNYRNIEAAEINNVDGINCFVGVNGAGKTNVLDSLYYLSFCKSLTGLPDSQNLRHHQPFFLIQGRYSLSGDATTDEIYCGFKPGAKKQFKRNKKEYERLSDHIGLLPMVLISPSDEMLIADGGEARRKYADGVLSQCDNVYLLHTIAYSKLIKQRNTLLKTIEEKNNLAESETLLNVLDEQIATHAEYIGKARREFIGQIEPTLNRYYSLIAPNSERVGIRYKTCLDRYDLVEGLRETHARDVVLGYTSRGIHKDDIEFLFTTGEEEYSIKRVGSQGQRKSFIIALKLAQYAYLCERKKTQPMLLLDDIFDKLDGERGDNLVSLIATEEFGQIFITDTNMERLRRVLSKTKKAYKIWSVDSGKVEEIDK
ncbi:MAG: DNA replication/repair protein RecF [Bacteroidales bacterium]|nr:DNA replication/repair protein RecF [Bacteroidales bacterium]